VAIAYDEDGVANPHVALNEAKLALMLDAAGYRVGQWTWLLADGKGIDDLMASGLLPFPIPHPAITQERTRHPDPEDDPDQRYRDLSLLHSLSTQARRSPNLGAERHTLTDLAMALSAASEGELVPMCYAKLGEQASVSASTAERQLAKVGIRPKQREAGLLTGLIEVELRPGPERVDPATGATLPGRDTTYMRRIAPVRDILERIATAPPAAAGVRNGHGGKRLPCPNCGDTRIERTITDRCAGCGELLNQTVRVLSVAGEEQPPQDAARSSLWEDDDAFAGDPLIANAHGQQDAVPSQRSAERKSDSSPENVYRGSKLLPDPGSASCGPSPITADREGRRARARADLEARYGAPPPAQQDRTPAQATLNAAGHAQEDADFYRVTDELSAQLVDIALAHGRAPVPKPTAPRFGTAGDDRWTNA
jgi:hypothetical protein